jgi:hypothetical protein
MNRILFSLGLLAVMTLLGYQTHPVPDSTPAPVRFTEGGAKFVRMTTETRYDNSQRLPAELPGAVRLILRPTENRTGLDLKDLKARQAAEQNGLATQSNGSASLPTHNDLRRLDGQRLDF